MASREGQEVVAPPDETEQMVIELANDYSDYVQLEAEAEQNVFEEEIEQLLTRLDEYCGLVDIIRSDTTLCLNRTLPAIQVKSRQMNAVFDKIDKLEAFVAVVKKDVQKVEELVNKAESEMGSLSSIKRAFNAISLPSIFTKRNVQPKTVHQTTQFVPPEIFSTEKYLRPSSQGTKDKDVAKDKDVSGHGDVTAQRSSDNTSEPKPSDTKNSSQGGDTVAASSAGGDT